MIGPEKVESGEQRVTLFSVTLAAFLAAFDASSVNIALPAIGKEFSMDAISLEWVATAYLLISAMLLIPLGRVADIFGRKRVFLVGILTFIVASFSIVFCGSGTLLICFRVLQGIGYAMIYGTGMALLTSVFPPQGRGRPWVSTWQRPIWVLRSVPFLADSSPCVLAGAPFFWSTCPLDS